MNGFDVTKGRLQDADTGGVVETLDLTEDRTCGLVLFFV